jgi:hypothetical protein
MNKEKFKSELISACTSNKPESFLPFLLKVEIETETTNKMDFYNFFKGMLDNAHQEAQGNLKVKIEVPSWETDKELVYYNFFDEAHLHPLLSLTIKENNNKLNLDIIPF